MEKRAIWNKIIWTVGSIIAFCLCFLLCRYSFFGLHGMKQYPVFLLAVGLIAIIISAVFNGRKLMICIVTGYIGGFVLGMIFGKDSIDQGGSRINNAWQIWTVSFVAIILIGAICELVNKRMKMSNAGIIRIIRDTDGPTAVYYENKKNRQRYIILIAAVAILLSVGIYVFATGLGTKPFGKNSILDVVITRIELQSGSNGDLVEITDTNNINTLIGYFTSTEFSKKEYGGDSTGWSYRLKFYDMNNNLITDVTVMATGRIKYKEYYYETVLENAIDIAFIESLLS